jgi:hypothetical protein
VIWNVFVSLPLNATTSGYLQEILPQIASAKAICLLTVEPDQGLAAVTPAAVQELASTITTYEKAGASFMIRYAHEMNGNWFVWGQQPAAYIASHQLVAGILRNSSCGVAMVWGPNAASGGYPWTSAYSDKTAQSPAPVPGSADFKAMDTNGDGTITSADDPYLPYYPGDAWVDWVGMSSFHFGGPSYPYTLNQQPAPNAFTNGFTGTGLNDFYGRFSSDTVHMKPMVITETSAMYNPSNTATPGNTNFDIKQVWWQQVFNVQGASAQGPDMSVSFPNIKAVMWFDELKKEAQAGGAVIDWRFTGNQQIQSGLGMYIQTPAKSTGQKYWLQLSDYVSSGAGITCSGSPAATATSSSTTATSNTTTSSTTTTAQKSTTPAAQATPAPPTIQGSTPQATPAQSTIQGSTPAATTAATPAATTTPTPAATPRAASQTIQSTATYSSTTPTTTTAAAGSTSSQIANLAGLIGRRLLA